MKDIPNPGPGGGVDTSKDGCFDTPIKYILVNNATNMENYQCSGFVGLAPKSSIPGHKSFLEQVEDSKTAEMPAIFSIYMTN